MSERITDADPTSVAADPSMVPLMISGGNRNSLSGTGDLRPRALRPGSEQALAIPSRMGNRLHYRDGRVETIVQHLPSDDTEGGLYD